MCCPERQAHHLTVPERLAIHGKPPRKAANEPSIDRLLLGGAGESDPARSAGASKLDSAYASCTARRPTEQQKRGAALRSLVRPIGCPGHRCNVRVCPRC